MNDRKENDDNGGELLGPAADNRRQLELFGEAIKLENRRLDEQRKRTELAYHLLNILDQQNHRQVEFATKQLEANERTDIRRYRLASWVVWVVAILACVALSTVTALVFFGTPEQSSKAIAILEVLGIAAGGGGVGHVMLTAMRRLLRR